MTAKLYIIIRNDIHSMTPGRAMSMSSHITSDFHACMEDLLEGPLKDEYKEWKMQSAAETFGTVVVVHADLATLNKFNEYLSVYSTVEDDEYHYRNMFGSFTDKNVVICAWAFYEDNELLKGLPLV